MTIGDEISGYALTTFKSQWATREGRVVPEPKDLQLGNDAVLLKSAAVLYADLDQSTALVEQKMWWFAAEVYKSFLYAASRIINRHGGWIVSYDGDRVMAIFLGDRPCNVAVSCALELNYAVKHYVQGSLDQHYRDRANGYKVRHVVGIDQSDLYAARTGVRGDNDIVWVGNAANIAAKLTACHSDRSTYITGRVHEKLEQRQLVGSSNENMWSAFTWTEHQGERIYGTSFWRTL